MYIPIAIDDQYISSFLGGNFYDILDTLSTPHWEYSGFLMPFPYLPLEGYTTYSVLCFSEYETPFYWYPLNTEGNWVKIAEFTFDVSLDISIIGDSTQIIEGLSPRIGGMHFVDDTGENWWHPQFIGGFIDIVPAGYEYLPGDANMAVAGWPPMVTGADITYLVYYFLGQNQPCLFEGFYAAGDANGSCQVTNADVTYLVNFLIGLGPPPTYCPDYEPAWPPLPPEEPDGWPNCETTVINSKVIPTGSDK